MIELLSIDLSNYCSKQCSFCYNHSAREGNTLWTPAEVIAFSTDCINHGIKAVSLGGGEPFEYDGVFDIIDALYPLCYLSVTTNGLPLENPVVWDNLKAHKPDKIHLSIHHPDNVTEEERVAYRLQEIAALGIKPGVNLLVSADNLEAAKSVFSQLTRIINRDQIILIPQRLSNTPSPKQLAYVAGGKPFQSPSCLLKCQRPKDFCSVSWDKKVNSCSYAHGKQSLTSLDYQGLLRALDLVTWGSCTTK